MSSGGLWAWIKHALKERFVALLAFAGLLLVTHAVLSVISAHRLEQVNDRWAADGRAHADLLARYPRQPLSDTALQLETLVIPLGLSLSPAGSGRGQALPRRTNQLPDIREWLQRELADPSGRARQPHAAVRERLVEDRTQLLEVADLLSSGDRLAWGWEPDQVYARPEQAFLAHLRLHDLLLAATLHAAAEGDEALAARFLDAAWRLRGSHAHRIDTVSVMVEAAEARREAGVIRKLESVAPVWLERLRDESSRARTLEAFQFEAWETEAFFERPDGLANALRGRMPSRPTHAFGQGSTGSGLPAPPWHARATAFLIRPVIRMQLSSTSEEMRRRVVLHAGADPCDPSHWRLPQPSFGRANFVGPITFGSGPEKRIANAEITDLVRELALRVHDARRLAADGELSAGELEQLRAPSSCIMGSWDVAAGPEGAFSISWVGGDEHPVLSDGSSRRGLSLDHHEAAR